MLIVQVHSFPPVGLHFVLDNAIGRVEKACADNGYILMVTSDHGNAEKMFDGVGGKHTAHTCNRGKLNSPPLAYNRPRCWVSHPKLMVVGDTVARSMQIMLFFILKFFFGGLEFKPRHATVIYTPDMACKIFWKLYVSGVKPN